MSELEKPIVEQNPAKQVIVRTKQGRFVKGAPSPNPHGAGLTTIKLSALFSKAFVNDKDKHAGLDLFAYAFKRARTNDRVLIALLNKFAPDLIKGEGFDSIDITQIFSGLTTERLRRLADARDPQGSTERAK